MLELRKDYFADERDDNLKEVGKGTQRQDMLGHVTGASVYFNDHKVQGMLHLKVAANGEVSGHYFSDKDGKKYDVEGKVGTPPHSIQFRIMFPRTIQDFQGWLFTGDGRALTGSSRLQERETGFYALRVEE